MRSNYVVPEFGAWRKCMDCGVTLHFSRILWTPWNWILWVWRKCMDCGVTLHFSRILWTPWNWILWVCSFVLEKAITSQSIFPFELTLNHFPCDQHTTLHNYHVINVLTFKCCLNGISATYFNYYDVFGDSLAF